MFTNIQKPQKNDLNQRVKAKALLKAEGAYPKDRQTFSLFGGTNDLMGKGSKCLKDEWNQRLTRFARLNDFLLKANIDSN